MLEVATVLNGHSQYNDDIWTWLHKHYQHFPECTVHLKYPTNFDYIEMWGLFVLAGCRFEYIRSFGAVDWVCIYFFGTIEELIDNLNRALEL